MSDVLRAVFKALVSQVHPRMLWLAIWPFLLSLMVWGGLAWWLRDTALTALHGFLNGLTVVGWIDASLGALGMSGFKVFLAPLIYIGLLIPTIIVSALLVIALYAMPAVIRHVAERNYPDVARQPEASGLGTFLASVSNSLWVTLVFIAGWVLTMPLWLIAPLALLLPVLWLTWLTARILRVDSLLEHASAAERDILIARHGRSYYALGLLVTLMNFIPPLFFFAPVFSGLAFTHFSLHALRNLRASAPQVNMAAPRMVDMGQVEMVDAPTVLPDSSDSSNSSNSSEQSDSPGRPA